MVSKQVDADVTRHLPKKLNPLLAPDKTPEHAELTNMRRLGQTDLSVRPGQVGGNNATKPEYLGRFDYAHLRAPLPEDLKGSGIFAPQQHQPPPSSYFLMRRSSDGFISATGMFKAAFPWAKHSEELSEKEYVKGLSSTAQDEIAGNVWISEHLDSTSIQPASDDPMAKSISPPPPFKVTAGDKAHLPPPNGTPARGVRATTPKTRGRPRAGSPEKKAGSPQKSAKRSRPTKAMKEANAATAREASASLQSALNDAASVADGESVTEDKVKVDIDTTVEKKGDIETTTTNVKIEMPKGEPDLPLPERPEEMIAKAKEMVIEAQKMNKEGTASSSKRKAEELEESSDLEGDGESHPAKRARVLEQQIRKEKIRNRSLIGVVAAAAIGVSVPYFFG
ncbi:uncharacterized protein KY384_007767 [Bacidia gigantensis]|uniref:uncharacterized protein n=1 Tax=Bacidia gigantensis TaxID=2732470 RepID=UPI001D055B95|nr:uncharacterized protein KY384_007767 [Bacidia gigantensis]KAG8527614.1 hypothetical protein KY384_007767 [Bacidia gigantensis]